MARIKGQGGVPSSADARDLWPRGLQGSPGQFRALSTLFSQARVYAITASRRRQACGFHWARQTSGMYKLFRRHSDGVLMTEAPLYLLSSCASPRREATDAGVSGRVL